ncbi:MAG TPA: hypothetical protein P5511_02020, partial [Candidatus Goldiibacteriota bacterium]|nr:hypothetical protein [Candidatus Goldiibacteriota bacterium]
MKKRPSLLLVLMLVSLPISAAGLALYYWSYEKKAAVEAALEQLEFVRMMPHVITNGEKIRLPAFTHNSIMASNKRFSGSLS